MKKDNRELIISVGHKDGTQKVSATVTHDEYMQASNEALGMMICSTVAKLKEKEPYVG